MQGEEWKKLMHDNSLHETQIYFSPVITNADGILSYFYTTKNQTKVKHKFKISPLKKRNR